MFKTKYVYMDGEPGGAGGGGAAPPAGGAAPPAGGAAPPAGGAAPPAGVWYDGFQDQGVKDWLKSYGEAYPDPEAVATKALNLEKFIGADKAGRGIITPKPDATPDEWRSFYAKVGGVPEKPDGYKLPEKYAADPLLDELRTEAHKWGMPPAFFDNLMTWYGSKMESANQNEMTEFSRKSEAEMTALRQEWQGLDWDKNVELSRRAAKQFIPHENDKQLESTLIRLEGALGSAGVMKLLASIGGALGEHDFESGEGGGGMGGITPEAARLRINTLKQDKDWVTSFTSGDSEKRKEWDKLHLVAFGNKAS